MSATTTMHIRIDEETKAKATQTLDELGLSVSDAVRMFLKRVVLEEGLPLTLKVPNAGPGQRSRKPKLSLIRGLSMRET